MNWVDNNERQSLAELSQIKDEVNEKIEIK